MRMQTVWSSVSPELGEISSPISVESREQIGLAYFSLAALRKITLSVEMCRFLSLRRFFKSAEASASQVSGQRYSRFKFDE